MKIFGIYEVVESYSKDGRWLGYICSVTSSEGKKQGTLYPKSDGRQFYKSESKEKPEKGTSEDLEI